MTRWISQNFYNAIFQKHWTNKVRILFVVKRNKIATYDSNSYLNAHRIITAGTQHMFKKLNLLGIFLVLSIIAASVSASETSEKFIGNEQAIGKYTGNGKWLIVMIWASDCHVCNQEAHQYDAFHKKHQNKDATVLGLSMDGKEKTSDAIGFLKRHKLNFPNLIGEPMNVAQMYQEQTGGNWVGTPSFMVFNPKGELIGAQAGAVPVSIIESFIERESSATAPSKS